MHSIFLLLFILITSKNVIKFLIFTHPRKINHRKESLTKLTTVC